MRRYTIMHLTQLVHYLNALGASWIPADENSYYIVGKDAQSYNVRVVKAKRAMFYRVSICYDKDR